MTKLSDFILKELDERKRHYSVSPISIVKDFNIEQSSIESYNGRQLLEMLQNVDDACETATEKKAFIKLTDKRLIVANNGEPFSINGFKSILHSNVSAKTKKQNKIGQKGLGFRSILSWAEEVLIHSGGASVRFGRTIANAFLNELKRSHPNIATELQEFTDEPNPIGVLCVPEIVSGLQRPTQSFDTVIDIRLKEGISTHVETQISNIINKETLLFLNNLKSIEIVSPRTTVTYTKNINKDKSVTVRAEDIKKNISTEKTWIINRKSGEHKSKNYELAVAWTEDLSDEENILYSYFRTNVSFPFPGILHGTFELSPDRNELVDDTKGHNRFLIAKIIDLLLETALDIAARNAEANYLPLTFLNVKFDSFQGFLKESNFKEVFFEKLKEAKILPNVNGKYFAHTSNPVYYDYPVASILKGGDVNNLMPPCEDESVLKLLRSLTIYHYAINHYIGIIARRVKNLTYPEKAALIHYLLTYPIYREQLRSADFKLSEQAPFLQDEGGDIIQWDSSIFLPADDNGSFTLPKEISVRFINSELIAALTDKYGTSKNDKVIEDLKPLSVRQYSFTDVASLLVRYFNQLKLTTEKVRKLHVYLFNLFKHESKKSRPEELSDRPRVPVISNKSRVVEAKETYFGKDYGFVLTQDLFSFNKNKLLARPKVFGLETVKLDVLVGYFKWLGVQTSPRYSVLSLVSGSPEYKMYLEHVLRNFDYRKPIDSYYGDRFDNYDKLSEQLWGASQITVGYFDGLKEILNNAKPETIFRWIKEDNNLKRTLEENAEILDGSFVRLDLKRKQDARRLRSQGMRSYVRWLFSTSEWVPVLSARKKAMPDVCCTAKTISEEFSPYVEQPNFNVSLLADVLGLTEEVVKNYLVLVGIHRDISDFSTSRLYGMLNSLPTSDSEGKVVKSIYREVIYNFNENRLDKSDRLYKTFTESGEVFCYKGKDAGYFPVREAYYVETKTIGDNILSNFPLVAIDGKRGTQKVKSLFGVNPLKNINFKMLSEPELHPLNAAFSDDILRFKPLVYVLRMRADKDGDIRNRLKRLKILICPTVESEFEHNGKSKVFDLKVFEFIPKNRTTFYVRVPLEVNSLIDLKHSVRFCESVAEIFTSVINTEDYRDFLHDLYSRGDSEREPRLLSYTQEETTSELQIARTQLGIIDDMRLSFWRAFASSSKRYRKVEITSEEDISRFLHERLRLGKGDIKTLSALDINLDLSDVEIQELLYQLFVRCEVNYSDFLRHFSGLDFSSMFQNKLEDMKVQNQADFALRLYEKLSRGGVDERKRFFRYLEDYDDIVYDKADGFISDIAAYLKQKVLTKLSISLTFQQTTFSIESLLNDNRVQLESSNIKLPQALLERKDVQALLLFEEWEELQNIIKQAVATEGDSSGRHRPGFERLIVRGKEIQFENLQSLAEQIIKGVDFSKLKIKKNKTLAREGIQGGSWRNKRSNKRAIKFNTRYEELAGFVAELYSYNKLCDSFGKDNVRWVSENAFKANYGLTSEAGKGYDIEVIQNGEVRYIEVKGVSDVTKGIKMSKNEINKAMEYPNKYDVLIVENPLSENFTFKLWEKPFRFRGDETLMSNRRFKVSNDSYILQFIWAE
ncbi:MAG: DUF3883 domain-containing protein [Acidobacteriota bacterium]|nr:DUF3883 domain-containing protein [Acidobacteriota bacterium]